MIVVVYVINRRLLVHLGFEIPEKVWQNSDPSYWHLTVFKCKTLMRVPKEQRLKLNSKSNPFIFVGYGEEEHCYMLYVPDKRKFVRSRDVFYEHEMGADLLNICKATT